MRIQYQTNIKRGETWDRNLPPMTFESPEKILVRLETTISAESSTEMLMKFPIVSSMTMGKSYSSANCRSRLRLGVTSKGFDGNSQNSERTLSPDLNKFSNSSNSSSDAWP